MGQGDDGPNAGQRQKYAEIQAEMEADMQYFDDPAVVHDMECVWYLRACMSARACVRACDTHTHTHTHTHTQVHGAISETLWLQRRHGLLPPYRPCKADELPPCDAASDATDERFRAALVKTVHADKRGYLLVYLHIST